MSHEGADGGFEGSNDGGGEGGSQMSHDAGAHRFSPA